MIILNLLSSNITDVSQTSHFRNILKMSLCQAASKVYKFFFFLNMDFPNYLPKIFVPAKLLQCDFQKLLMFSYCWKCSQFRGISVFILSLNF
jgi:hypothetical protein